MIEVTVTPAVATLIAVVPAEILFIASAALSDTADAVIQSMDGARHLIAVARDIEIAIIMGTTMVAVAADTSASQAFIWISVVAITGIDAKFIH